MRVFRIVVLIAFMFSIYLIVGGLWRTNTLSNMRLELYKYSPDTALLLSSRLKLSDQSRKILDKMTEPFVIIGYFGTKDVAQQYETEKVFRALYDSSNGNVTHQFINPDLDATSAQHDEVTAYGTIILKYDDSHVKLVCSYTCMSVIPADVRETCDDIIIDQQSQVGNPIAPAVLEYPVTELTRNMKRQATVFHSVRSIKEVCQPPAG